jgi:hypothetical protein
MFFMSNNHWQTRDIMRKTFGINPGTFVSGWLWLTLLGLFFGQTEALAEKFIVDVTAYGAVADAKKVDGRWVGTDNAAALNRCAAYCRAQGLTMFFPKGDYGVASTVWLTDPKSDGLRQAALSIICSNRGAYLDQHTSANICVLTNFSPGRTLDVKKEKGTAREPVPVPVLAVSNGRQVHVEGLGIQGNNFRDLICGFAVGNVSQLTTLKNCSVFNLYAGVMFPGLRDTENESVREANNDLLVIEQSTFRNTYNIICAGTQPFSCEYRSSVFGCTRSVLTGTLITNLWGQSGGSHKFSSCLFGTGEYSKDEATVYFDLQHNAVTIDSCQFETNVKKEIPDVLIRRFPNGGVGMAASRFAFTNNIVNFTFVEKNPDKFRPLIDEMSGARMLFQSNTFRTGSAVRIKSDGGIFIGNIFYLGGEADLDVAADKHPLAGAKGDIQSGRYDFNHFIRKDSEPVFSLPGGQVLKRGTDYKIQLDENAFTITEEGKAKIDKEAADCVLIHYKANDASGVKLKAWGGDRFNPPDGWRSRNLTLIANKVVYKTDTGASAEAELDMKKE